MNASTNECPPQRPNVLSWVRNDYVIRVLPDMAALTSAQWHDLLAATQAQGRGGDPFMTPAYLGALHTTGCASPDTGWTLRLITLWTDTGQTLAGACPLYEKDHSRGEYVFDWAWAEAYHRHGLPYYPKAVIGVPFTPVPGARLLVTHPRHHEPLLQAALDWCAQRDLSSLHLLLGDAADMQAANNLGMMPRQTVQFHWQNDAGWPDFDAFLADLSADKRKKIRQERRKVREASVQFEVREGHAISEQDWDLFYRCYDRTYREHGNPPYLSRAFFAELVRTQPANWVLFLAYRRDAQGARPIACSLIAINSYQTSGEAGFTSKTVTPTAYGRYWGALERVDCLHFEACYYQPLAWCLARGITRFEGGAQGEHKLARALLPVTAHSAHWLAHPGFAEAVDRYLERERDGVAAYAAELAAHSPLRQPGASR